MNRPDNAKRLSWFISTFGIPLRSMGSVIGFSAGYISRASKGDPHVGSDEFYAAIERNLVRLLELRTVTLFESTGVAVERLKKVA